MSVTDTIPAWALRQRNRRIGRHQNEMVVRWIALPQPKDQSDANRSEGIVPGDVSTLNGNVVMLTGSRQGLS